MATLGAPRIAKLLLAFGRRQPGYVGDQQRLLGHEERRRRERLEMALRVLKVPLDPHGAEHEPAELYPRQVCREAVLDGSRAHRVGRGRLVVAPRQFAGCPASRTVKPRLSLAASAQRFTTRPARGSR